MDVALVADVEDEFIFGGFEDAVESDGEFDDAEIGAEVAAGAGEGGDEVLADAVGVEAKAVEIIGVAALKAALGAGLRGDRGAQAGDLFGERAPAQLLGKWLLRPDLLLQSRGGELRLRRQRVGL
jgi:hypothetical protein